MSTVSRNDIHDHTIWRAKVGDYGQQHRGVDLACLGLWERAQRL